MPNNIRNDFKPYWDLNGLLANRPVSINTVCGSDNGPMFTSEFYIMLAKSGQLTEQDKIDLSNKISNCIQFGMLNRVPVGQNDGQEGPDDYLGVLSACVHLDNVNIPKQFLKALIKNFGFLNNENPGKWTKSSFLVRQPQLVAAMIAASFPSKINPIHWFIRLLAFPLFLYSAIAIAISCINTPRDQADPRRLCWHLIQVTTPVSVLCRLASLIWFRRLYKEYGPAGMKAVAGYYYFPKFASPFAIYWVN